MPSVLIVDENKPSIVMTSEIIKDHVPGVNVDVVGLGKTCLESIQNKKYDLIVIDFDLPDADGVTLAKLVRSHHDGPILITAFEDDVVEEAIKNEMFFYSDICSYIKKPIDQKDFALKLNKYLLKKEGYNKHFSTKIPLEITKNPKTGVKDAVKGHVFNMSLNEAGISTLKPIKGKVGDEVSLVLSFKKQTKSSKEEHEMKIKAQLVWMDKSKKKANFQFSNLSEKTQKELEEYLRAAKEI